MKRPRIALTVAFAFLIVFRIVVEPLKEVILIVAMINIVALSGVLFDVTERLKTSILTKIETSIVSTNIAARESKNFRVCFYTVVVVSYVLLIACYFRFWCCGLGNDIISIVALAISFLDDEIITLGTFLYKV